MINWTETKELYGYGSIEETRGIKRPSVVVYCWICKKRKVIQLRYKQEKTWVCYSCSNLSRSDIISANVKKSWSEQEYRQNQLTKKSQSDYKENQATKSKERWADSSYRSKLQTGVNKEVFIQKSAELYKGQFDYSNTNFGSWQDKITVTCNNCRTSFLVNPQKHIEHGYCHKCGASSGQRQICDFLSQHISDIRINDRTQLSDLELDIFLPQQNVAIEYHGLYWHSYNERETIQQKTRHQLKATQCHAANIHLFQFFDFEWDNKQEIIKSMILNRLGVSQKLDGRKLSIEFINNTRAKQFFDSNHLYGHRLAKHIIALTNGNDIISAVSFSKSHNGYEIIRSATKLGYRVRGGLTKSIHAFRKYIDTKPIYTYADLRYSLNNAYLSSGFKLIKMTSPGYFYSKQLSKQYIILSRQQCQKSKLEKLLAIYDGNLTESQNMFNNGYRRTWDAGHLSLVLD